MNILSSSPWDYEEKSTEQYSTVQNINVGNKIG